MARRLRRLRRSIANGARALFLDATGGDLSQVSQDQRELSRRNGFCVRVKNAYPIGSPVLVSARCYFEFKSRLTEQLMGSDIDDKRDYRVPPGEYLLLRPHYLNCVSAFRLEVVIWNGTATTVRRSQREDRPGKCWTRFEIDCVPD